MTTTNLNEEQEEALRALRRGSVMVLAGPGSGKTHTLAAAVRSLRRDARAARALCLTFTTKAAEHLRRQLGRQPRLFVGTFHALAARLLPLEAEGLRLTTDQELLTILAALRQRPGLGTDNVRELSLSISRMKNGSLSSPPPRLRALLQAYDAALTERGLLDYDDLILRALAQAEQGGEAYDYIFVDEFQDTSPRQYDFLRALAGEQTKLFVIGDPKQSIYRFRGADGSVFRRLEADFSPQVIHLPRNYRSVQSIVEAANRLFPDQSPQLTERGEAGRLRIIETLDEYSEPAYVLAVIEHALGGTEWHRTHHDQQWLEAGAFRDFAVLYRTQRQGELLAAKLRAAGLPLQRLGEESPYASPLAQVVIALLAHAQRADEAMRAVLARAADAAQLELDPELAATLDPAATPRQLVREVAVRLGQAEHPDVLQLETLASRYDSLAAFLAYVEELSGQAFFDPAADAVCLSTIHASKGLEFRHVFVTGCNEGLLPSRRARSGDELDEERRLFYVALTRARDSLLLVHSRRRGKQAVQPSSFLQVLAVAGETDEALAATERRRERSRRKRAQQRLL